MSTHGSSFSLNSDTHIHGSVIHNSQTVEANQSVHGEMNREIEGGLATQWNITPAFRRKEVKTHAKLKMNLKDIMLLSEIIYSQKTNNI